MIIIYSKLLLCIFLNNWITVLRENYKTIEYLLVLKFIKNRIRHSVGLNEKKAPAIRCELNGKSENSDKTQFIRDGTNWNGIQMNWIDNNCIKSARFERIFSQLKQVVI